MGSQKLWMGVLATGAALAVALTVAALPGTRHARAASPNTGMIQMEVDCDTVNADVQNSCDIATSNVAAIPIDVVLTNNSGVGSQIDSFDYDLYNDQCSSPLVAPAAGSCIKGNTLNPAGGIGPSVPVVDATNFPVPDYNCGSPPPSADRGSGLRGTSTSFLSCVFTFGSLSTTDFPAGSAVRLSGETFADNVTFAATIVLTPRNVASVDDNFVTTISCDAGLSGPCFSATLHFLGPPAPTPTPTLTPTLTWTPTRTPMPTRTPAVSANPDTGRIQMEVDCDTSTTGVQNSCDIATSSVAAIPIDVVMRNTSDFDSQIDSFNYDLYSDQCSSLSVAPAADSCISGNTLNPAGGIGPSVPVRDVANFPTADDSCDSPLASADRGSGLPGTSTSFLSCVFTFAGTPADFPAVTAVRLSGENFSDNVTFATTIVLTLSNVRAYDDTFVTTISCDPVVPPPASPEGSVDGPCFAATLHFQGPVAPTQTPCAGPCPTPTPIPTRTPTPTRTPVPTGTATPTPTQCAGTCPTPTARPNPNTGMIQMEVDCDTNTEGVQNSCDIATSSVAAIPIDVVLINNSGVGSQIDSFNYDLYNGQCSSLLVAPAAGSCIKGNTLNPAGGIGPS
ncbi:MAG: hypothetical protein M3P30_03770, partial [Chloroflexota bacterium]|nr:hypothetical protein [Chloroflexota bacterium]